MKPSNEVDWGDDWQAASWLAERNMTCVGVYEHVTSAGERLRFLGDTSRNGRQGRLVMRTEHHGLFRA